MSREFDAEGLRKSYAAMPLDDLLDIVSKDADSYIDEALDLARAELQNRGVDEIQLGEQVRDLKARRYDDLVQEKESDQKAKLPRWMFWVCLIESSTISTVLVIVLFAKGRKRAAVDAWWAIMFGWLLKFGAMMLIPSAQALFEPFSQAAAFAIEYWWACCLVLVALKVGMVVGRRR